MKNHLKQIVSVIIALCALAYVILQISLSVGDMIEVENVVYAELFKLRAARFLINEVIEMFGSDVTFGKDDETSVEVNVYAAKMSIIHFAKGFAPSVTILSPDDMAKEIKGDLCRALEQYE